MKHFGSITHRAEMDLDLRSWQIPAILGEKSEPSYLLAMRPLLFFQQCGVFKTISSFNRNPSAIKLVPVAPESQGHTGNFE